MINEENLKNIIKEYEALEKLEKFTNFSLHIGFN